MRAEVSGIPVNYLDLGSGPETAVILQGWGTNLDLYRAMGSTWPGICGC